MRAALGRMRCCPAAPSLPEPDPPGPASSLDRVLGTAVLSVSTKLARFCSLPCRPSLRRLTRTQMQQNKRAQVMQKRRIGSKHGPPRIIGTGQAALCCPPATDWNACACSPGGAFALCRPLCCGIHPAGTLLLSRRSAASFGTCPAVHGVGAGTAPALQHVANYPRTASTGTTSASSSAPGTPLLCWMRPKWPTCCCC